MQPIKFSDYSNSNRFDPYQMDTIHPPFQKRQRTTHWDAFLNVAGWTIGGGVLVWLLLKAVGA